MDKADIKPSDIVLEVGPGAGALTAKLLEKVPSSTTPTNFGGVSGSPHNNTSTDPPQTDNVASGLKVRLFAS